MAYHSLEELLPASDYSVYRLVRMASARATELADGKPRLIDNPSSEKTTTIALDEIREGKVTFNPSKQDIDDKEAIEGKKGKTK